MSDQKIFIGSDPIATKEKEQFSNRRWLKDVLERPIFAASNIRANNFTSSLTQNNLFDRRKFFELSGIKLDIDSTHFYYNPDNISKDSIVYLKEFIPMGTIYIGYELSEQTRSIFDRADIRYVDIWLHPIRYLDDIIFGIGSNVKEIRSSLLEYDTDEYQYYMYADRLRVQAYKGWARSEINVPANSALFVGQMLNDKSICCDGRMLSVLDFQDEFTNLVKTHENVLYSRHPYIRRGDEDILKYVLSFPNVTTTDLPTYSLLSHKNIKTVMGVSSSVLIEAKYFGKKSKILYKPVININKPVEKSDYYASIYNDLVNPAFWSDLLSSVIETNDCTQSLFLSGKDKIRDMLGFYWSYKEIDKIEEMRVGTDKRRAVMPASPVATVKQKVSERPEFRQTIEHTDEILKSFRKYEVISFDIFETLIERIIDKPSDIFDYMELDFQEIFYGKYQGFSQIRANARGWAFSKGSYIDEVPLADRYQAIKERLGLSQADITELMLRELDYERKLCRSKFMGQHMYKHAREVGKRIIFTSDTYFDRNFIEEILLRNGYAHWDHLYLSSEHNSTKSSGRLFDIVLKNEKFKAKKILHIGDNLISDIKNAAAKGISTLHVPERAEIVDSYVPLNSSYKDIANGLLRSATQGLVGTEFTKDMVGSSKSFTGGDVDKFGYCIAGPIFFGFAKWILDNAREQGIDKLFFLSRDGHIIKRCYDIIAKHCPDAPPSQYVYASRRSTRVAELFASEDIQKTLETSFSPSPIGDLLKNRFGIDASVISDDIFLKHGFNDERSIADWKVAEERIREFFSEKAVVSSILKNSKKERAHLIDYYKESGMDATKFVGLVDIGHSGTIQSAIIRIMGLQRSLGLYFATFDDIRQKLPVNGHDSNGYLLKDASSTNKKLPYVKNILMYELLFLNSEESFSHITSIGSERSFSFVDSVNDEKRKQFADDLHDNIVRFIEDLTSAFPNHIELMNAAGSDVTKSYNELLNCAFMNDIQIFSGLSFENTYSGRVSRWIVPPFDHRISEPGIWNEAMKRIRTQNETPLRHLTGWRKQAHSVLNTVITAKDDRKAVKFQQDAGRYFSDSKWRLMRNVGHIVYNRKSK
ncbi:HAD family hydrolase [Brucella pituitosa]|uniref:HAD family hydrolase n=1 Tax=Brucella pituitosa TaxID=571256 RepID=UPI003F4A8E80